MTGPRNLTFRPHCFLLKRLLTPPEMALPALTTPFFVAVPALAMPFFSRVQSCSLSDLPPQEEGVTKNHCNISGILHTLPFAMRLPLLWPRVKS